MRIKTVFFLFNILVLLALCFMILTPFFFLGREHVVLFWKNTWLVALIFLLFIGLFDGFFLKHWRFFSLLERSDRTALLDWLEDRIYGRKRLRRMYIGFLINTALSVSDFASLRRLEAEIRERRSSLLPRFGVSLGIPVLLDRESAAIEAYFSPLVGNPATRNRDWACWCRGFGRTLSGERGEVLEDLMPLLEGRDLALRLLTVYLLSPLEPDMDEASRKRLIETRDDLRSALSGKTAEDSLAHSREENVLTVVLSGLIVQARRDLMQGIE